MASDVPSNRVRPRNLIRAEALYRLASLGTVARFNGSLLVTEFPKSGGTWLSGLLADAANIDFPQNRFPGLGPAVYHGHYLRRFEGLRTAVLWRDPRDIVVSWYFHCLLSSHANEALMARTRADLGFEDLQAIVENLPAFIAYMFTRQRSPGFSWNTFFDTWVGSGARRVHTSYERLSIDPEAELARLVRLLALEPTEELAVIVARHSFEAKAGRQRGSADNGSFLRKGVAGDWVHSFSPEAERVLAEYTGGRLEAYAEFVDGLGS